MDKKRMISAALALPLLCSCTGGGRAVDTDTTVTAESAVADADTIAVAPSKSRIALRLDSLGYKNIAECDPTIAVDLMYTRPDNFTGRTLYTELREAYLHPLAMERLLEAQRLLRQEHPDYRLIVYDAARPMSVQAQMWAVVRGTAKERYVSNPAHGGGLHNYGLAVDISILDSLGRALPMGTKVDHLGREANITDEAALVAEGRITEGERQNRLLLRRVMKKAGFRPLPSEWWHFNYCSRDEAKRRFQPIP